MGESFLLDLVAAAVPRVLEVPLECSMLDLEVPVWLGQDVVFPVPERPKNKAVCPSGPSLAEQCMESTLCSTGRIKLRTVKIPFFISPVYPVPPIMMHFSEKLMIAKFLLLTPSVSGFASKAGALITVH